MSATVKKEISSDAHIRKIVDQYTPQELSEKVRGIERETRYNLDKFEDLQRKSAGFAIGAIVAFVTGMFTYAIQNGALKYLRYALWILLVIFVIVAIVYYRKSRIFRTTPKQEMVYRLVNASNLLEEFIKSDTNYDLHKKAKRRLKVLIVDLTRKPSLFGSSVDFGLSDDHGFKFANDYNEFIDRIVEYLSHSIREIIDNKRDDGKYATLIFNLRKIALYLENEEILVGLDFTKKGLGTKADNDGWLKKLIKRETTFNVVKEVAAFVFTLIIIAILLWIIHSFGILNLTEKQSLFTILGGLVAVITIHIQLTRSWGNLLVEYTLSKWSSANEKK